MFEGIQSATAVLYSSSVSSNVKHLEACSFDCKGARNKRALGYQLVRLHTAHEKLGITFGRYYARSRFVLPVAKHTFNNADVGGTSQSH